jgi:hypothetical protein
MSSKWRRFEVMFPIAFNDGKPVPRKWYGKAFREVVGQFSGGSLAPQPVVGAWRHKGVIDHERNVLFICDIPDTEANRRWMHDFKARWKAKLEQLELWMVSYRIEVE